MSEIIINHHYPNSDPEISRRLGRIEKALTHLIEGQERMALDLSNLRRELTELGAAVAALVERLRNSPDQTEINAIVDQLDGIGKQIEALAPVEAPAAPTE